MPDPIPARAGIGLRTPHFRPLLDGLPDTGWLEIHAENYFCAGGPPLRVLEQLRAHYPLSMHCVGLSLGSASALDSVHMRKLAQLADQFQPDLISDHVSWGMVDGQHFNDLLPLPYTEEALAVICGNVAKLQDFLGRRIAVENISAYLEYRHSTIPEWQFVAEIVRRTGCAILLDVNNIHVNAVNHGIDPAEYLRGMPVDAVAEIHLAGFEDNGVCLIDTHSRPVSDEVWKLYADAVRRFGPRPTLIEWDADIPALEILLAEAAKADAILEGARHAALAA